MNRDEIEQWAFEAARSEDSRLLGCGMDDLMRFAKKAYQAGTAAERNACIEAVVRDNLKSGEAQ